MFSIFLHREESMSRRVVIFLVVVIGFMVVSQYGYAQCSMCVTGLTQSQEGQAMAQSFNRGILFLLAVPYGIVMFFFLAYLFARSKQTGKPIIQVLRELPGFRQFSKQSGT